MRAAAAVAAASAVLLYTQLQQSSVLDHGLQTVLDVQSVLRGPVSHAMMLGASLLGGGASRDVLASRRSRVTDVLATLQLPLL